MNDLKEVKDTIEVPKNTGIEGFLQAIRGLLRLPKIVDIHIDARGKISYRRYVREADNSPNAGLDVEWAKLQPAFIVRNTDVEEVSAYESTNAGVVIGSMLDMVAVAQLHPLAFVTGADTVLWEWYRVTTGVVLRGKSSLHGLPLYTDRNLPDTALILTAGYGRDAELIDARNSYKLEMSVISYPKQNVEVMI